LPLGTHHGFVTEGLEVPQAPQGLEAHGGMVGVDTAPGAGATFWLELPRYVGGYLPAG
jgi:light-regulated signal transduction histidine kinase (bacteriophytochrome)